MLCISGTQYATTQDDEFSTDTSLNYTSAVITSVPASTPMVWSTQFTFGTRNNAGTDDAYYTDPSRGFGGFSPFSLIGGALNITAEPVPSPYATAPALSQVLPPAHWLSGVLEGPAQTYGYIEVSAKEPNLQGFWPAAIWVLGLDGADGRGDGYEELDGNELFGNALGPSVVQQTQLLSLNGNPPGNTVRTTVAPDPSTAYHTYGILWTPTIVQFFIDRKATSPQYTNAAFGPANPIINLQVFTANTYAPPPATATPQTLSLQYYRWYQAQNASCSPSILSSALRRR